jgi:hypothetical protein
LLILSAFGSAGKRTLGTVSQTSQLFAEKAGNLNDGAAGGRSQVTIAPLDHRHAYAFEWVL